MSTRSRDSDTGRGNVYLLPVMQEEYRGRLTRLMEAEQFGEAKSLLRFLLSCRGQDEQTFDEWRRLLDWLEVTFPEPEKPNDGGPGHAADGDLSDDEDALRARALLRPDADNREDQIRRFIEDMKHPSLERRLLALEKAVYIDDPEIDRAIRAWLTEEPLHPSMQFRALQTLKRRGASGRIMLDRAGERVELEIELTPLTPEDYPHAAGEVLERVCRATEAFDPTLPLFAREMWEEIMRSLYGTADYEWLVSGGDEAVDCWAAALHLAVMQAAYGQADEAELRLTYGIPESLRFRFDQALRAVRRAVRPLSAPPRKP